MTNHPNRNSGLAPRGDWMQDGILTGKRNGLVLRAEAGKWYAILDGYTFGPARVIRYSDADYLDVDGTAWEYSLDAGEADRLVTRGVPVVDKTA